MIAMDLNAVIILFFAIIAAVVVANSLIRERVSLWRFIRRGIVVKKPVLKDIARAKERAKWMTP